MAKPSISATWPPAKSVALKSSSALIIFITPDTTVLYCMRW
jgi:hypothetical protein